METSKKSLNIALWVAQILLGVMFTMAGIMKISQPIVNLAESLPWVTEYPASLIRFIGVSELLGGLGLVIPSLFRFKPFLTIWAAIGLASVMVLATLFHISRGEFPNIGMTLIIMGIALFIAWGRSKKAPIYAK